MDSINRNQPEKNHEDLAGRKAVEQIKTIAKAAENCFFCTHVPTGPSEGARPMNVRRVDEDGTLWFLSAADSHKNEELSRDSSVTLYFQGSTHSDFLRLHGQATVSKDKAKIREL